MVVFGLLPKESKVEGNPRMRQFYNLLTISREIPRKDAVSIGKQLGLSERTVGNYLEQLFQKDLLSQPKYGVYIKKE